LIGAAAAGGRRSARCGALFDAQRLELFGRQRLLAQKHRVGELRALAQRLGLGCKESSSTVSELCERFG
jgi:hypothetical protein